MLHGKGHAGAIGSDLALAALQAQPLAQHGATDGKPRDPETGLFRAAQEAEPLAMHGGSRVDNIKSGDGGTSQAYLLRRLARDAPDVLERVKAGEFKSARAKTMDQLLVIILFPTSLNRHKRKADKPKAKAESLITSIPDIFRNQ